MRLPPEECQSETNNKTALEPVPLDYAPERKTGKSPDDTSHMKFALIHESCKHSVGNTVRQISLLYSIQPNDFNIIINLTVV